MAVLHAAQGIAILLLSEDVRVPISTTFLVFDEQGLAQTVRYHFVNAMLLNEFLKEHRTVEELKATMANQAKIILKQEKQLERLTSSLEQVNHKIELVRSTPQLVAGN